MLLVTHILIALSSLAAASAAVIHPSINRLRISYTLTAATIVSGTALVIATHSPLLSSCLAGLTYTAVALSLIVSAQRRLAKKQIDI